MTEATASNGNTFNAKTNGNVKGQKVILGVWMTCDNFFRIYIYVQLYSRIFDRVPPPREAEKRKYAYRSVDSKRRERERKQG